jgi:hypothetical protein
MTRLIPARLRTTLTGILRIVRGLQVPAATSGQSVAAAHLSPAEVAQIVEDAYVYGFPMIVGYKVLYEFNVDRSSGQFKAPFNQISNEARVFTYKDTTISTPNSDTLYSMVQMDLRAEPIVLGMPEIEKKRYYDVQLVDMYTGNYGYIGSRTTGNGAGCYLIAGPDWKGQTPPGFAKVFRCETQFSLAIYRTQLFDPGDMDNVKKVQAGYKVQPLSSFLGQPAPPPAPAIEWPKFTAEAFKSDFAEYLDFLLQFCPPVGTAEVEKPLREKFASIGIGPGKKIPHKDLSPSCRTPRPSTGRSSAVRLRHPDRSSTASPTCRSRSMPSATTQLW